MIAATPVLASTATEQVDGGSLAFVSAPGAVNFSSVTLDGTDQTTTATLPIDVGDNTGSGSGWNVTLTTTQFTTGGDTPESLPTTATTVSSVPEESCDEGATCTLATNDVSYPYDVPAGSSATATEVFDAAANSGMGDQTVTPEFTLAVPANTYAGTYTSTWTFSLTTGP